MDRLASSTELSQIDIIYFGTDFRLTGHPAPFVYPGGIRGQNTMVVKPFSPLFRDECRLEEITDDF